MSDTIRIEALERFDIRPATPLLAGIPALPTRKGWAAQVTFADGFGRPVRWNVSKIDGEGRWVIDGEWHNGSVWPKFWNGRASRCTSPVFVPAPHVAALEVAIGRSEAGDFVECPRCEGLRCEERFVDIDDTRLERCGLCHGRGRVDSRLAPPMAPGHERVLAARAARQAARS